MDTARTASLTTLNTLAERCGHVTQSFVDQVQLGLLLPVLHAVPALLVRLLLAAGDAVPALPCFALPAMRALPAMPCCALPAMQAMLCLLWLAMLCMSCTPAMWLHSTCGGWGAGRAVWAVPGWAGGGGAGVPALPLGRAVRGVGGAHLQPTDPCYGGRPGCHRRGGHHQGKQLSASCCITGSHAESAHRS